MGPNADTGIINFVWGTGTDGFVVDIRGLGTEGCIGVYRLDKGTGREQEEKGERKEEMCPNVLGTPRPEHRTHGGKLGQGGVRCQMGGPVPVSPHAGPKFAYQVCIQVCLPELGTTGLSQGS